MTEIRIAGDLLARHTDDGEAEAAVLREVRMAALRGTAAAGIAVALVDAAARMTAGNPPGAKVRDAIEAAATRFQTWAVADGEGIPQSGIIAALQRAGPSPSATAARVAVEATLRDAIALGGCDALTARDAVVTIAALWIATAAPQDERRAAVSAGRDRLVREACATAGIEPRRVASC